MSQQNVLAAIGLLILGALVGGVVRAMVERYAIFKESKGIAGAIKAELDGLFAVVEHRKYLEGLDYLVKRLENENYQSTVADLYSFRVTQDYFQIFHALAPKIGLLGSVSEDTAAVYIFAKSVLEDMRVTGDMRATMPLDQPFDRMEALRRTKGIQMTFLEAHTRYQRATRQLTAFMSRRWCGVFP